MFDKVTLLLWLFTCIEFHEYRNVYHNEMYMLNTIQDITWERQMPRFIIANAYVSIEKMINGIEKPNKPNYENEWNISSKYECD